MPEYIAAIGDTVSTVPTPRLDPQPDGSILLWVKAVPGASRDQVAGAVGDRLKIRVAARPEGGRANTAICETLASVLGLKPRQVSVHSGHGHAEKIVRITGVDAATIARIVDELCS